MSQTPEFVPADFAPPHVSVVNEFPEDLYDAMRNFVRSHPHWDQYRLMQVAVAGFLFQQGCRERAVARHYLDGLFDRAAAAPAAVPLAEPAPAAAAAEEAGSAPGGVTPLRQRAASATPLAGPSLRPVTPPGHHPSATPLSRRAA